MAYRNSEQKKQREAMVRDAVEGWRRSGLTQEDYCLERDLKLTTFRGWSREYRAREREQEQLEGPVAIETEESNGPEATPIVVGQESIAAPTQVSTVTTSEREELEGEPVGDLIVVDVVNRGEDRSECRRKLARPDGSSRSRALGSVPERGRSEPIEIELPSGIVIRLGPGSEAWRVAGIVREVQNTC